MKEFSIKKEEMYFDAITSFVKGPSRAAAWKEWLESGMADFMYSYRCPLSIDPSEINNAFGGSAYGSSISFRWFYFYEITIDRITYLKAGHSMSPRLRCKKMKQSLSFSNKDIIVGEPTIFPLGFLTQSESETIERQIFYELKNLGALEHTPFIVETFVRSKLGLPYTLFEGATEIFQYISDDKDRMLYLLETIADLDITKARRLETEKQLTDFKIVNWLRT